MAETGNGRLKGTQFYKAKGLKGISIRVPTDTRKKLKLLAAKLNVSISDAVQTVIEHYVSNNSKYNLDKDVNSAKMVDMTIFITPEYHTELRIGSIYAEQSMKEMAGRIVHQYVSKHTRIKLERP